MAKALESEEVESKIICPDNSKEVESEMTANYVKALKMEEENWKKVRNEIKKNFKKCKSHAPVILSWENCEDLLTDEDKEFLAEHPDYKDIMANYQKLTKTTAEYMRLKKTVDTVFVNVVSTAESILEDTVEQICNKD